MDRSKVLCFGEIVCFLQLRENASLTFLANQGIAFFKTLAVVILSLLIGFTILEVAAGRGWIEVGESCIIELLVLEAGRAEDGATGV